ncbi:hypothetical protein ES703_118701 [subsurface metagenome]
MNQSIQSSAFPEIVTTSELLKRLKIGRTKLFELKKNGTFTPGRHFFKNGRVLRFVWGADLIEAIHENTDDEPSPTNQQPKRPTMTTVHATNKSTINLDY